MDGCQLAYDPYHRARFLRASRARGGDSFRSFPTLDARSEIAPLASALLAAPAGSIAASVLCWAGDFAF